MISYNIQKCQFCSVDLVTDDLTKEVFCKKCGIMINQFAISLEPEHYSSQGEPSKSRTGDKISNKYHDNRLSTTIGNSKHDGTGGSISKINRQKMDRLRKLDNRYKITSSRDRCLRNALFLLNDLEEKLFLPEYVVEETASLYRKVLDSKLAGGRTVMAMISACTYASCRINSMPITLREIAKTFSIRQRDIAMCYRIICKEFDIQSDIVDTVKSIPKIASRLHLDQSTISVATNIVKITQKTGNASGKNPTAIVATAIYLASIFNKNPKTQKDVAIASGITEATIRNRCKDLKKIIEMYRKPKPKVRVK